MKYTVARMKEFPYVLLVLATFFWGTNFVISRVLVNEIPPVHLSLLRWIIAGILLFPFLVRDLKRQRVILQKNWRIITLMALTGVAGFNTLLYIAVQYTTSINASLVNSTGPLFMVLLAVLFLKEKMMKIQYIGVIVSFTGVLIIITKGRFESLWSFTFNPGDLLVLVAIVLFSVYSILMKKFGVDLPQKTTFMATIWIAILCLFPFSLWEQPPEWSSLSLESMLSIVYLGVFPSIVSFICWNEGVMKVGPAKASNFLHLIVLFTAFLAVAFGIEKLTWIQLIGGAFILTGVLTASNPRFARKAKV